ncbi:hypothetical protein M011DRAFT_171443 [Sporormia fimetaria CBS 119925]|uniref:Uncharacterized protein n=1 Tax=Sporormia fimetaria CBS 119925 TaxID=1340428 RepID=A0A6A6V4V2_9PLEO|nr:hypothetical protein M011DRAFT_171443 [Sporormia fimetaria CBS 119925]
MATEESFVLISSALFDRMRQHCMNCDQFNGPLQVLSDGRVAPEVSLPNLKKRKVSQSTESTADVSTKISRRSAINDTGLRPSLQPSGTWPSLLPGTGPTTPAKRMGKKITLALRRFLGKVPIRTGWRERQARLGLNTVQEYEDVVKGFCSRAYIMEHWNEPGGSGSGLIALGKHLANLTKASLENANLLRSFAYFQVLILLSYCEFLRQKGVSEHTIDELIQPVRARERDRRTLLDTIPRIHRLIVDLVRRGWTLYRATELFFISMLNEAFDYILQSLSADTFAKYHYDDCLTPSYTIPGLIASQLRLDNSTDKNLYGA